MTRIQRVISLCDHQGPAASQRRVEVDSHSLIRPVTRRAPSSAVLQQNRCFTILRVGRVHASSFPRMVFIAEGTRNATVTGFAAPSHSTPAAMWDEPSERSVLVTRVAVAPESSDRATQPPLRSSALLRMPRSSAAVRPLHPTWPHLPKEHRHSVAEHGEKGHFILLTRSKDRTVPTGAFNTDSL